ncbi:MAG: hypothetical protein ACREBR_01935, partial [bacterium]
GIFFKCNFRSCTNIDRNEVLHDCSNEKCGKQVHHACYIRIMETEMLNMQRKAMLMALTSAQSC